LLDKSRSKTKDYLDGLKIENRSPDFFWDENFQFSPQMQKDSFRNA
jgi:hypothetical protein